MAESDSESRCPACGAALRVCPVCSAVIDARPGRGRPRVYCTPKCRWRAGHVAARQRWRARAPGPGDLPTMDQLAGVLAAQAWPG